MAKAVIQLIPSEYLRKYKKNISQLRETGFQYYSYAYWGSYGGLVGKRFPVRMKAWQEKFGKQISPARNYAQVCLKETARIWKRQSQQQKEWWYEMSQGTGIKYYQYFVYWTMWYTLRGLTVPWETY